MSAVKQQAAKDAMTHFLRYGWADSFQDLVNYLLLNGHIPFQKYGRTGPEALNNITRKVDAAHLVVIELAKVSADLTISAMMGATPEVQKRLEELNKVCQSWSKFATINILSRSARNGVTGRHLFADFEASHSIMKLVKVDYPKEKYTGIPYKMHWNDHEKDRDHSIHTAFLKEAWVFEDHKMKKIHKNNQKNGYDVMNPDAGGYPYYGRGPGYNNNATWYNQGWSNNIATFPRNNNYGWTGSFRGRPYDWKKHTRGGKGKGKGKYKNKGKRDYQQLPPNVHPSDRLFERREEGQDDTKKEPIRPDFPEPPKPLSAWERKQQKYQLRGIKYYGSPKLENNICRFWEMGKCNYGNNRCKMDHMCKWCYVINDHLSKDCPNKVNVMM